jgi:hypothetical protein
MRFVVVRIVQEAKWIGLGSLRAFLVHDFEIWLLLLKYILL